jgi:hypothetical protein
MNILQLQEPNYPLIRSIRDKYMNNGLKYGWKSNVNKSYDVGHWHMDILPGIDYFVDHTKLGSFRIKNENLCLLWDHIKDYVGDVYPHQVYINGTTYGVDNYTHQDTQPVVTAMDPTNKLKTVIVYLNDEWHHDYAGETVFFTDDMEISAGVLPKMGRLVVFDSMQHHCVRPLTKAYGGLRLTLMFKCIDNRVKSKEIDYLLKKGADRVRHAYNKSLFYHLYDTACILNRMKLPKELQDAGLYHSIYGTEFFKHDIKVTREEVRELIGEYAEFLAYEFCTTENRLDVFINNKKDYVEEVQRDLLYIEYANLLDQNDHGNYDMQLAEIDTVINSLEEIINGRDEIAK